jgi:hypothetical protein
MAITIDSTAKSPTANSYISAADAELYFSGRPYAEAWTAATADEQNRVLIAATLRLDQERWKGTPQTTTQSLKWPRWGVVDQDYQGGNGYAGGYGLSWERWLNSDTIPVFLKNAVCELALVLLTENRLEDTGLELLEQVGVGDLNVTPSKTRHAGRLPEHCARWVRYYLISGGGTVRLERS